jgi:hypothetical protein
LRHRPAKDVVSGAPRRASARPARAQRLPASVCAVSVIHVAAPPESLAGATV